MKKKRVMMKSSFPIGTKIDRALDFYANIMKSQVLGSSDQGFLRLVPIFDFFLRFEKCTLIHYYLIPNIAKIFRHTYETQLLYRDTPELKPYGILHSFGKFLDFLCGIFGFFWIFSYEVYSIFTD